MNLLHMQLCFTRIPFLFSPHVLTSDKVEDMESTQNTSIIELEEYLNSDSKLFGAAIVNGSSYIDEMRKITTKLMISKVFFSPIERLKEAKESENVSNKLVNRFISLENRFSNHKISYIENNIYLGKAKHLRNCFYFYNINIEKDLLNTQIIDKTEVKLYKLFDFLKDLILTNLKIEESFNLEKLKLLWDTLESMLKVFCSKNKTAYNTTARDQSLSGQQSQSEVDSIQREFIPETNIRYGFIQYIWYLCGFIDQNIVFSCDKTLSNGVFNKIFINFVNISIFIYDAITKDDKIEIQNSVKIDNLSGQLTDEMIRFMEMYVNVYKQMHLSYLNLYEDGDMNQIEIFRIGSTILDTILCLMNMICNFKNIIENHKLKTYEPDIEFIEKTTKLKNVGSFYWAIRIFKNPYKNTGFKKVNLEVVEMVKMLLISFVQLLKLPVNFSRNKAFNSDYKKSEFELLVNEYMKKGIIRQGDIKKCGEERNRYVLEFSEHINSEVTNGGLRWIKFFSEKLIKYAENLEALKTAKTMGFDLDDLN